MDSEYPFNIYIIRVDLYKIQFKMEQQAEQKKTKQRSLQGFQKNMMTDE